MKNKILSTIQNVHDEIDNYLKYNAMLAKDFEMELELIAASPQIMVTQSPTTLVGSELPPSALIQSKTLNYKTEDLEKLCVQTKKYYDHVSYNIEIGSLESRIHENDIQHNALFWTINNKSDDNLINQVFGTTETTISKSTKLPSLTIPEGCEYVKPETLLLIVKDDENFDFSNLSLIARRMNLRVLYAFHEDEKKTDISKIMANLNDTFGEYVGTINELSLGNDRDDLDPIIDQEKPQWIAYSNYDRNFYERLFKISTNQLILSSKLPLLLF